MIRKTSKNEIRTRIHKRIRAKLRGTPERPRLAVFRSVAHIYAQVIDDSTGHTVVAASSAEKDGKGQHQKGVADCVDEVNEHANQSVGPDDLGHSHIQTEHGFPPLIASAWQEQGLTLAAGHERR